MKIMMLVEEAFLKIMHCFSVFTLSKVHFSQSKNIMEEKAILAISNTRGKL